MADSKITALAALTTADPANDMFPVVDVSDTSMAASGTTKRISINNILACSPSATLASATITGDLTVDTSTLKVDSTNNRVIVGHTSGSSAFQVTNAGAAGLEIQPTGFSSAPLIQSYNRSGSAYTQLTLDGSTIVHALSGTTAMTLNSTGLGIGVSPATKLDVRGANNASQATFSGTAGRGLLISTRSDGLADDRTVILNAQHSTGSLGQLVIQTAGTDRLLVDSSGNVGIGVTPSAWGRGKGLEVGSIGNAFWGDSSSNGILSISANAYLTTSDLITGWKYATTNPAGRYQISETTHSWYTAASGTINTAITFTQAMTLDASGNLLVGTTSLLGTERLIVTKTTVGSYLARFINTNTTVDTFGITVKYSASAPNDASHNFLYVEDNVNVRAQIYANGGLANYSANNVNLSDARTKTDIKPLTSYWNKIKALELVTFKYKDQTHDDNNIGLISQQVESVAPEFVSNEGFGETPADGVPLKSIYTTDLYHAAIKALQEAMTRIEVLESKLA